MPSGNSAFPAQSAELSWSTAKVLFRFTGIQVSNGNGTNFSK